MFNIYLNENDMRAGSKYPVIAFLNEAANESLMEFLKNMSNKVGTGYDYAVAYFWNELDDYDKENTAMFSGMRIETEAGDEITVPIDEIIYYVNILLERCKFSSSEIEEAQKLINVIVSDN